jgi:hypothetical protein
VAGTSAYRLREAQGLSSLCVRLSADRLRQTGTQTAAASEVSRPVDVELHAAVCEPPFEKVAVALEVVEFEDASGRNVAEEDHS